MILMETVLKVRSLALREGRDSFEAVRDYLVDLGDIELEAVLEQFESRKTIRKRLNTREKKIKVIVSRACQGDAFLTTPWIP